MAHHVLDSHFVQSSLFTDGLKVMAERASRFFCVMVASLLSPSGSNTKCLGPIVAIPNCLGRVSKRYLETA